MSSVVNQLRSQLESVGEYVVLANIASGWFAVFESTLIARREVARRNGREGPNLIVYRTLNEVAEPRDHHVVPYKVFDELLADETVAESQVKSSRRWNFTLKGDRLRVTHGVGYIDVASFFRVPLLGESTSEHSHQSPDPRPLQLQSSEALEGIARELRVIVRSRSSALRDTALQASKGVCEACGIDFSGVLGGLGARSLQVHHKNQLAHAVTEAVTRLDDLAVVCANCHALLHSDRTYPMPVHELRDLWNKYRGDA